MKRTLVFFPLQHFIDKFRRLHDSQFVTGKILHRGPQPKGFLRADAYGHCLTRPGEARALRTLFECLGFDLLAMNDDPTYGSSPRQRVLAFLEDAKAFKITGVRIPVYA